MNRMNLKISAGYITICVIWGSTWLAIKIGLESLTPVFAAGIRFSLAALFIYIFMKFRNIKLQTDRVSIIIYITLGLFSFVIPFGLVYWSEQFIPSGLAAVLFAVFPFFVIIYSLILLPGGSVDFLKILGVIFGFLGIVVIFSNDISLDLTQNIYGMAAVLISAAFQGGMAVMIKRWGTHINPLSMNLVPLSIAGPLMLLGAFLFENSSSWQFDFSAIGSVVYLALFGTLVTFTIYYWLLKQINVVIVSLSSFITPIIAILIGWIFGGENFSARYIQGSSLVLIGILFANFSGLIKYFKLKTQKI